MNFDGMAPVPDKEANKYTRGKLVVVAGSARYPGAAALAARASQRAGAGYTEVVTAKKALGAVRAASPSLVVRPFSDWDASELSASDPAKPRAVCIGPGFTGSDKESEIVMDVLESALCPVLVDGGALGFLALRKGLLRLAARAKAGHATVVTPHGGEAARLARSLGLGGAEPQALAGKLALSLRALVVLKGPDTVVTDGMTTRVMDEGTPALAKAGTGDVLAGIIGALLAQGVYPAQAAFSGALLHARAGAAAAEELTEISVTAEDVIDFIPQALKRA